MPPINDKRLFRTSLMTLFGLAVCVATVAAQVSQTAPPPNRSISAPAPQAHQPQQGRQPLPLGTSAPRPIMQPPGAGTIQGFVYWDTSTFTHTPASSCDGLSLTVSVANGLGGPFKGGFTALPTVTNNFKYVGQVKTFLYGGKNLTYDVCTYAYDHLPVGPQLKVEIGFAVVRAFSPIAVPQPSILGPITIINGKCNMLPHTTTPTLSDLTAKWSSCQNMAIDVNFVLQPGKILHTQSATGGGSSLSAQRGILSSAPQQGMLAPGNPQNSSTAGNVQFNQSTKIAFPGSNWKSNRFIASAMSHISALSSANSMPGTNAGNSALIAILRKQSLAQSLLVSSTASATRGGSTQPLNSQMSTNSSTPQIGSGQIMSSPGSSSSGVSTARTVLPAKLGTNVIPSQVCMAGIGAVDGQRSGVWFSPLSGPDGTFVIQGCGFGTTPGQIYLSGVHYASASTSSAPIGSSLAPDQVGFLVASGNWSDRQIVAQIDANASGFYDTNNITVVVKTANGQLYQAAGFNFTAARTSQVLTAILKAPSCWTSQNGCVPAGINLASVNSVNGQVQVDAESPTVSLIKPGETIAVARQTMAGQFPIPAAPGLSFPGATDVYQFKFAPGFQLDPHTGVQLQHTSLDKSYCQSVNGVPATNGNWSVNYLSTSSFQVSWQEEACWPQSSLTSASTQQWLEYGSVSAYALDITVLGPRGVSPWPSSNTNVLTIQKHQQFLTH
jgi:hypothetical protein